MPTNTEDKFAIRADAMYLRHKTKGTIYGMSTAMAKSKNVEAVTGKEAYPELFAPKSVKEKTVKAVDVGDLGDDAPAKKPDDSFLSKESAKGLKV